MARTFTITATLALLCLAVALPAGQAVAQQKQQVSIKAAPENSKYMQQQQVDVGDAPNHVVRVFDVHHTYPGNAPVINGLKLIEEIQKRKLPVTIVVTTGHGGVNDAVKAMRMGAYDFLTKPPDPQHLCLLV